MSSPRRNTLPLTPALTVQTTYQGKWHHLVKGDRVAICDGYGSYTIETVQGWKGLQVKIGGKLYYGTEGWPAWNGAYGTTIETIENAPHVAEQRLIRTKAVPVVKTIHEIAQAKAAHYRKETLTPEQVEALAQAIDSILAS